MQLTIDDLKKIQDVEKTAYPEHQWKFVGKSLEEVLKSPHFKNDDCFYMAEKNWYVIGRKYNDFIYVEDLACSHGALSSLDDFFSCVEFLKGIGCLPICVDAIKETSFPFLIAMKKYEYISFLECKQTGNRHHQVCFVIEPCSAKFELKNNLLSMNNFKKDICFSNSMASIAVKHSLSGPLFRSTEGVFYGRENIAMKMKNTIFINKRIYIHEIELDKSVLCRMDLEKDRIRTEQDFDLLTDSPKWKSFYESYGGLDWSDYTLDDFGKKIIPQDQFASYSGLVWSDKAILKSNLIGSF